MPFLPQDEWALATLGYVTIIIETLIPVLLCIPRLRMIGILIGMVFHYILAFDIYKHFFDFSSTVFTLYFLFTAPNFLDLLQKRWETLTFGQWNFSFATPQNYYKTIRWLILATLSVIIFAGFQNPLTIWLTVFFIGRQIFWFVYGSVLIVMFALSLDLKQITHVSNRQLFTPNHVGLLIMPLLVFLNGVGPYVGFKTRTSIDMYSNLRLETGQSNHYIVPGTLDVLGYMTDLVTIVDSSDEMLQQHADTGLMMTHFKFREYVSQHPNISVTYIRDGKEHHVPRVGDDHVLSEPPPFLLSKLLNFRPVDSNETSRCLW
jgi:hypothetical protein